MNSDQKFELAFDVVISHEGGLSNHPNDDGGLTKYGISQRYYPDVDVKNLTLEQAKEIYKKDWWDRYHYGLLNFQVALKVFDMAINMGPTDAHKYLQMAVNYSTKRHITVDGIIGKETIEAVNSSDEELILLTLRALAANHYLQQVCDDPEEIVFLKGWLRRAYK